MILKNDIVVSLSSYSEEGVTAEDIVARGDHSHSGIFSHINFNESDVDKCYNKLLKEGKELSNVITRYVVAYTIRDEMVSNLILSCSALLSSV